jgi:LemA protein
MDAPTTSTLPKNTWLFVILGVIVLLGIWVFSSYNGLVQAREGVDASWAQVETQYQRRFDLIPNLQNTVKGAANFEQTTLQQVTAARTQWQNAGADRTQKVEAAQQFDSALSRLLVTVEAYPQLQATQAFRDFMTQLEGTENRISTARRDYNEEVRTYNVAVKTFPRNLVAGLMGFGPEAFFQNTPGAENAPAVNFED